MDREARAAKSDDATTLPQGSSPRATAHRHSGRTATLCKNDGARPRRMGVESIQKSKNPHAVVTTPQLPDCFKLSNAYGARPGSSHDDKSQPDRLCAPGRRRRRYSGTAARAVPKFPRPGATLRCELRNQSDTSKSVILVRTKCRRQIAPGHNCASPAAAPRVADRSGWEQRLLANVPSEPTEGLRHGS